MASRSAQNICAYHRDAKAGIFVNLVWSTIQDIEWRNDLALIIRDIRKQTDMSIPQEVKMSWRVKKP